MTREVWLLLSVYFLNGAGGFMVVDGISMSFLSCKISSGGVMVTGGISMRLRSCGISSGGAMTVGSISMSLGSCVISLESSLAGLPWRVEGTIGRWCSSEMIVP